MLDILGKRKIWYSLSISLILISLFGIFYWGLPQSIDFTGGSLLNLEFKDSVPRVEEIRNQLTDLNLGEIKVQPFGEKGLVLRLKTIDDTTRLDILEKLSAFGQIEQNSFESIGPTLGKELRQKSTTAIIVVIAAIIFYVAWAFRKATLGPLNSWHYGLAAVVALVHDVTIMTGFYAFLGHFLNVEIDAMFVTALLTVLGYSVNDTIVVFDRIREGLKKTYGEEFEKVANQGMNETISRTLNTTLTTLFVLAALSLFGGLSIRYFVLAMMVGIFFGTYSSIFVASPLLVTWYRFRQSKKR